MYRLWPLESARTCRSEPVSTAADWSGYLMAVYALLQFFMAPIFGNLSDRFGRRPLLLFSLFAFGVDFLLTGLATSMTWLFIGRAFAGVFGASFATAGAYIGDISNDENRARNFGFIGAAWGSGFTLGPVIGGFVAEAVDPRAPFFVDYVNRRDFSVAADASGISDLGPEGLIFIKADESPNGKPLLVIGNEISGTTTIFEINKAE